MVTKSKDGWLAAMAEELKALDDNHTWTLVQCIPNMNVIGVNWEVNIVQISSWKAHSTFCGNQMEGVDYLETFSSMVKPPTIQLICV